MELKQRLVLIVGFLLSVFLVVAIIGEITRDEPHISQHKALSELWTADAHNAVPEIRDSVARKNGATVRKLADFYKARAYAGAPPVMPHQGDDEILIAGNCLDCHRNGDYSPKQGTYAPVTPHPELLSCRMCHVVPTDVELFKESEWTVALGPNKRQISALPGSPPPIPHSLQMRTSCISCHTGPGAVKEIRTSHPERESCTQCHVPQISSDPFSRPAVIAEGK